jgi:hypothetical protein
MLPKVIVKPLKGLLTFFFHGQPLLIRSTADRRGTSLRELIPAHKCLFWAIDTSPALNHHPTNQQTNKLIPFSHVTTSKVEKMVGIQWI